MHLNKFLCNFAAELKIYRLVAPILNPQESFEVQMRYWGQEAVCQIKITWEDQCGEQEHIQALQLI